MTGTTDSILQDKMALSHMKQISRYISCTNHKIKIFGTIINIIVDLVHKKVSSNDYLTKKTLMYHILLIIIFYTLEKEVSNSEGNIITRNVRTYSAKSSSRLLSCSICAIYPLIG